MTNWLLRSKELLYIPNLEFREHTLLTSVYSMQGLKDPPSHKAYEADPQTEGWFKKMQSHAFQIRTLYISI